MKSKLQYVLECIFQQIKVDNILNFTTQYGNEKFVGYEVHRLNDDVLPPWFDPSFFIPELVKVDHPTEPHTHWDGPSSFLFLGSGAQYAGSKAKIENETKLWLGIDVDGIAFMHGYSPDEDHRFFFIPPGVAHAVSPGKVSCIWFLALHTPPIQGKYNIHRDANDVTHPKVEYINQ